MKTKTKLVRDLILTLCLLAAVSSPHAQVSILSKTMDERGLSRQFTSLEGAEQVPFSLRNARHILGLNPNTGLVLIRTEMDETGFTHYRYYQTYKNIPVENSMYIAHSKNGRITSMGGSIILRFDLKKDVAKSPSLSGVQAIKSALNYVNAEKYAWDDAGFEKRIKLRKGDNASYYPLPSLVWFGGEDAIDPANLKLAYKIDVYSLKPLDRKFIYVDAKSGKVLGTKQQMMHSDAIGTAVTGYSGTRTIHSDLNDSVYRLRDFTRGNGIFTLHATPAHEDYTSNTANWNLAGEDIWALDVHFGVASTWTFYKNIFNRNSCDNAGFAVTSWVNDPSITNNAYWDGSEMSFGNRGSNGNGVTSIDITGHEFTHGVTQFTCNLAYSKEPGAINESISDIMGKSVQFYTKPADTSWIVGNDMDWGIRSFSDPNAYGQPDTYLGDFWTTDEPDHYGVHTNSGLGNYMFYLLVKGGAGTNDIGDAYTVKGIGLSKAEQIIYRSQTVYLTSTSKYPDWRIACINAAADLYGIASNEVMQVENAWYAVGIGTAGDQSCNLAPPAGFSTGTITDTTATINWAPVPGSAGYIVQWRPASGGIFTSDTLSNTTSYNITGLTTGTYYLVQLSTLCGGKGNGLYSTPDSIKTTGVLPQDFCLSSGRPFDGITNVTFNTINNTTSGTSSGYIDYTQTQSTVVNKNKRYTLSVKINTGGDFTNYAKAWIDWNRDGVFSTNTEEYDLGTATNVASGTTTSSPLSVNVPANAATGLTRMRVSTQYNAEPTPCNPSFDGEVEDYAILVIPAGAPVCVSPAALSASLITNSSATLVWSPVTGARSYNIKYRVKGATIWINSSSATNSFGVTGLSAGTLYELQVATSCVVSGNSSYSMPVNFTTTGAKITYCSSKGTSTYEYINSVVLETINHTVTNDSGYGNYTHLSANLTAGNTYTIKLTPGFTGGSYTEYYTVFIDYNRDGKLNGPGEIVATGMSTGTTATSLSFIVPLAANNGSTRMRIQMQYGSASSNPCATLASGDVHDYAVNVSGAQAFVTGASEATTTPVALDRIRVFPNPVTGRSVKLNYSLSKTGQVTVRIVDMPGRIIQSINIGKQNSGSYTYAINKLHKLVNGEYYLAVYVNNELIGHCKLIVSNR